MEGMLPAGFSAACEGLIDCFRRGGKLLLCGNGGSAADCGHIAGEFLKSFLLPRSLPEELLDKLSFPQRDQLQMGLPAIDLCSHGPAMTAILNDQGGELIFAQQVMAFGRPGDMLLGISTSGNAKNVSFAMETAKALGLTTIALTGKTGGRMASLCDILLNVEETETYLVQQMHLHVYHQLCIAVEKAMFPA